MKENKKIEDDLKLEVKQKWQRIKMKYYQKTQTNQNNAATISQGRTFLFHTWIKEFEKVQKLKVGKK